MTLQIEITNDQVIIEAPVGTFQTNEILAVGNMDGTVSIQNVLKSVPGHPVFEVGPLPFADYVDENNDQWGLTEASTVNNLNNAVIAGTGPGGLTAPVVINPGTVQSIVNQNLFFTLSATGVGNVAWGNLPRGVMVDSNNRLTITGTVTGGLGTYNVLYDISNAVGVNSGDFDIEVIADAGFLNTRALMGRDVSFLDGVAALSNPLFRASDGAGGGDAWSFSFWYRPSTTGAGNQPILYFGSSTIGGGAVLISHERVLQRFHIRIGESGPSRVEMRTANNTTTAGVYNHVLVVYNGGTTANTGDVITNGTVQVYIDGVLSALTAVGGSGYTLGIPAEVWRYGREGEDSVYWQDCLVDELAIWDEDMRTFVAEIYAGGTVVDLNALPTAIPPFTWHRFDSEPYPTMLDRALGAGGGDLTLFNGVPTQLVNIIP